MNWLEVKTLNIDEILKILPHRYPFLMVDKVLEIKTSQPLRVGMSKLELEKLRVNSFVKTIKNVTINEAQFQGHFPGKPVMPGVLTLETMAQSAVFVAFPFLAAEFGIGVHPKLSVALVSFDKVRFRKPIVPGDQMVVDVTVVQTRGSLWGFKGEVSVSSKKVAEGHFLAQVFGAPE